MSFLLHLSVWLVLFLAKAFFFFFSLSLVFLFFSAGFMYVEKSGVLRRDAAPSVLHLQFAGAVCIARVLHPVTGPWGCCGNSNGAIRARKFVVVVCLCVLFLLRNQQGITIMISEGIEGRLGREGGARSSIRFDCFNSERFGGYWGVEWEGNLDLALYLFFSFFLCTRFVSWVGQWRREGEKKNKHRRKKMRSHHHAEESS
jgi:hypothetical protein